MTSGNEHHQQQRSTYSDKDANIRYYANIQQLVVLSNLESINAVFYQAGIIATGASGSAKQNRNHPNDFLNKQQKSEHDKNDTLDYIEFK